MWSLDMDSPEREMGSHAKGKFNLNTSFFFPFGSHANGKFNLNTSFFFPF